MGFIREPLEVDFFVEPRMLTAGEKAQISEHIRKYKSKQKGLKSKTVPESKSRKKVA
jgi:hypothetical protein